MEPRIAVIYYSSTGNVHELAVALAAGAEEAGAQVRLRRVAELAPPEAIDRNPEWRAHADATADLPVATLDDLAWADGFAFGTPTRFGNVASQLKQFIDTTGSLWAQGQLADKPSTAFTSAANAHGGNESTLLALYNTMYHWGTVIVPPGYTDDVVDAAGGNPYGTAHASGAGCADARGARRRALPGGRLVEVAAALVAVACHAAGRLTAGGTPDELVRCRSTALPRRRAEGWHASPPSAPTACRTWCRPGGPTTSEHDALVLGGRILERTKKFRDVAATGRAAVVIDDVLPPWRPRGVEVRGRAEAIEGPPAVIRVHPDRVVSWGLGDAT
jgi:NAD(P)H dehydrogenase (quinone)